METMQKKQEREKLLEEEMNSIKTTKTSAAIITPKVTKANIDAEKERENLARVQLQGLCAV